MEKRAEVLAWGGAVGGMIVAITALLLAKWANSAAMVPAALAGFASVFVALVAAGFCRFERRRAEEEAELQAYRLEHEATDLFADNDEGVRVAARACAAYLKWFVPAFSVLLALFLLGSGMLLWQRWGALPGGSIAADSLQWAVLALGLFVGCLVFGSYYSGASREAGFRWLRPCAAWMFCCGLLFLLAGLAIIGEHFQIAITRLDLRIARFGVVLLLVLGAEALLNFIIEFYRPRSAGEELRPLYESRLLAVVTEPGGMARNVATTLDYQFGFKVSETWFSRFVMHAVLPTALVMALCLWAMTCVVVVQADQQGLRESFGRVTDPTPLGPGLYFKLPWRLGRIITYDVERVQQVEVGYRSSGAVSQYGAGMNDSEPIDPAGRVILWSKKHNAEEIDFVVASKPEGYDEQVGNRRDASGALPVPVYFLAASVPVFYRVNDLYKYSYLHRDAEEMLRQLASREIVRHLATVDFFEILAQKRMESAVHLATRIQAAADATELGIEVLFVGLQGVHPPVSVGAAFHTVVEAMTDMHAQILNAESVAISSRADAEVESIRQRYAAEGYQREKIKVAAAEAERFGKQLTAYLAAPQLFVMRSYLDVLESEGRNARKYVVAAEHGTGVFVINLEEKLRPDLLDLDLNQQDSY